MGGILARLGSPARPAILAGSWCFFTSFASCVLTRGGMMFPLNGAVAGLFSGSIIGLVARWPRDQVLQVMVSSSVLSILSHYAMEGQQQKDVHSAGAEGATGAAPAASIAEATPPVRWQ